MSAIYAAACGDNDEWKHLKHVQIDNGEKGKKINIAQPVSSNQPKPKEKPKKLSNL